MKKIVLLIFLFVAAGKLNQAVELNAPFGAAAASQFSKKSDKSLVFKENTNITKSKFRKGKKRKPKGVEIKSLYVSVANFEFQVISTSVGASNYCSPELINTTFFVLGRAPPLA